MFTITESYSASTMQTYAGLDAVRKRQGMYIGGNDTKALLHLTWEILDNSVDEAVAGYGKKITITVNDDSITVSDHGRGIPVDKRKSDGKTGVELAFTELHSGGKFDSENYAAAGGLNGVGAAVVNALSSRVDVQVVRSGKLHTLSFKDGQPGHYGATGKFTPATNMKTAKSTEPTGTTVTFYPNLNYFPRAELDADQIIERCREKSYLVPGVEFLVVDNRNGESVEHSFLSENGLPDWVTDTTPAALVGPVISVDGEGSYAENIVKIQEDGSAPLQEVQRTMQVKIAFSWNEKYDTTIASFVNMVSTPSGGTHIQGFERALVKVVQEKAVELKVLKSADPKLSKEDILEGLTAVALVRIPEPQFEGQTKDKLGNSQAVPIVQKLVTDTFTEFCDNRKTKTAAKNILQKIVNAARIRVKSKEARDKARTRNQVSAASLPSKLKDCEKHTLKESEIFLIEGDSAGGTALKARDRSCQAVLPLRGKVLNALKMKEDKILKNAECVSFFTALGCGWKDSFDISKLRYGKIIIMTDADDDGHHIRTLILTLISVYLQPLLEAGAVFAAVPPLYEVKYFIKEKDAKGKVKEVRRSAYAFDAAGLAKVQKELKQNKDVIQSKTRKPVRMKGLGEAEAEALRDTTMAKGTRLLRRISVADAEAARVEFERLMGEGAEYRKEFIMNSYASKEDLEAL